MKKVRAGEQLNNKIILIVGKIFMQYINKFVRTVTFYYLFIICRIELYKIQKIELK